MACIPQGAPIPLGNGGAAGPAPAPAETSVPSITVYHGGKGAADDAAPDASDDSAAADAQAPAAVPAAAAADAALRDSSAAGSAQAALPAAKAPVYPPLVIQTPAAAPAPAPAAPAAAADQAATKAPAPRPAAETSAPPAPSSSTGLLAAAVGALAALLLVALWRLNTVTKAVTAPAGPAASATPPVQTPSAPTVAGPAPTVLQTVPSSGFTLGPVGPHGGALVAGNYETRRELGAGGMGVVYEAVDVTLDRPVALKRMRPEVGRQQRGKERFLTEARTVAKLRHPNIVGIHAVLEDAGDLYLVLEYVDGETLESVLGRLKRLNSAQTLAVLAAVGAAVDYAHGQKVIHRDLKPSNIMIDRAGQSKVMDFGIAHQAKVTISQLTMAEAFGTQAYMPPEQELGQAVRESDVYALAAVAYEALTGTLPFPGPNFHLQKTEQSFARPSTLGLPPALDAVFERALQPDPKKRYPTARELTAALSRALAPSPA
jgi:hypothetical protein